MSVMLTVPEEIVGAIRSGERFTILSHKDPDGDSLGCSVALFRSLSQMGKRVYLPLPEDFPRKYEFMRKYINGFPNSRTDEGDIIVIDCSCEERINWLGTERNGRRVISIDHHEDNPNFGDLNWVEPESPAAGDMIFHLLRQLGAPIDEKTASALYVAIMTDTGRFSFSNATPQSFFDAGELVKLGANPRFLTGEVYFNFSEDYLRNIGIALFNAHNYHNGRILFLTLDRATTQSFSTSPENSEGIIDFAMSVRGVDVAALFKEIAPSKIRVSLRSRRGIDISEVAKFFGGGGHPNAAGCTINANLTTAQEAVLEQIRKVLGYR